MTPNEQLLFGAFVSVSKNYLEFGSGGSTCVAASLVQQAVTSVESSTEWIEKVRLACDEQKKLIPSIIHVNIGPVREFGFPKDDTHKTLWPSYYETIWQFVDPENIDTYLIDGRFRVNCFLSAVKRASRDAILMIHDFSNRPQYHIVKEFAREIAVVEKLSVFVKRDHIKPDRLKYIMEEYAYAAD